MAIHRGIPISDLTGLGVVGRPWTLAFESLGSGDQAPPRFEWINPIKRSTNSSDTRETLGQISIFSDGIPRLTSKDCYNNTL